MNDLMLLLKREELRGCRGDNSSAQERGYDVMMAYTALKDSQSCAWSPSSIRDND